MRGLGPRAASTLSVGVQLAAWQTTTKAAAVPLNVGPAHRLARPPPQAAPARSRAACIDSRWHATPALPGGQAATGRSNCVSGAVKPHLQCATGRGARLLPATHCPALIRLCHTPATPGTRQRSARRLAWQASIWWPDSRDCRCSTCTPGRKAWMLWGGPTTCAIWWGNNGPRQPRCALFCSEQQACTCGHTRFEGGGPAQEQASRRLAVPCARAGTGTPQRHSRDPHPAELTRQSVLAVRVTCSSGPFSNARYTPLHVWHARIPFLVTAHAEHTQAWAEIGDRGPFQRPSSDTLLF